MSDIDIYTLPTTVSETDAKINFSIYMKNLKQKLDVGESSSTPAFKLNTLDTIGHWTWLVKVFPRGQHGSECEMSVYVMLIGCRDQSLDSAAKQSNVKVTLKLEDRGKDSLYRTVRHDFDWSNKRSRWTRIVMPMKNIQYEHLLRATMEFERIVKQESTYGYFKERSWFRSGTRNVEDIQKTIAESTKSSQLESILGFYGVGNFQDTAQMNSTNLNNIGRENYDSSFQTDKYVFQETTTTEAKPEGDSAKSMNGGSCKERMSHKYESENQNQIPMVIEESKRDMNHTTSNGEPVDNIPVNKQKSQKKSSYKYNTKPEGASANYTPACVYEWEYEKNIKMAIEESMRDMNNTTSNGEPVDNFPEKEQYPHKKSTSDTIPSDNEKTAQNSLREINQFKYTDSERELIKNANSNKKTNGKNSEMVTSNYNPTMDTSAVRSKGAVRETTTPDEYSTRNVMVTNKGRHTRHTDIDNEANKKTNGKNSEMVTSNYNPTMDTSAVRSKGAVRETTTPDEYSTRNVMVTNKGRHTRHTDIDNEANKKTKGKNSKMVTSNYNPTMDTSAVRYKGAVRETTTTDEFSTWNVMGTKGQYTQQTDIDNDVCRKRKTEHLSLLRSYEPTDSQTPPAGSCGPDTSNNVPKGKSHSTPKSPWK